MQFRENATLTYTQDRSEAEIVFQERKALHGQPLLHQTNYNAAGLDVRILCSVNLDPGAKCVFDTGLTLEFSSVHFQFASRSGLLFKYAVEAFPGVIDRDYRGPIVGRLRRDPTPDDVTMDPLLDPNLARDLAPRPDMLTLNPGERVAQLLPLNLPPHTVYYTLLDVNGQPYPRNQVVRSADPRGAAGFGSSQGTP